MIKKLAIIYMLLAGTALGQQNFNRGLMKEIGWTLIRPEYTIETGERTLIQGWADITSRQLDDALEFLESYASTDNIQESRTVTIPKGDHGDQTFSGSYIIGLAYYDDQKNMIIRELHRITTISTIASLAAAQSVSTRENEILDLFNFKTGEGDQEAFVWRGLDPDSETACMVTLSDAALIAQFATGWTYAERRWKVEDSGTATYSVGFQKRVWNTWATNTYDHIAYTAYGRDGEIREKTWENYRITDMSNMVTYLSTDTNADTDFHVFQVQIRNNRNGSMDVSQQSTKIVEEKSSDAVLADTVVMNPHDFQNGTQSVVRAIYGHFDTTELALISETAPSGYTLTQQSTDKESGFSSVEGLYTRTYVYEKVEWKAWVDAVASDHTSYSDFGRDGEQRNKTWENIQIDDASTAVAYLATDSNADTNFHVISVNIGNKGNGSCDIGQQSIRLVDEGSASANLSSTVILSPHDLQSGTQSMVTAIYEHYSTNELAGITEVDISGYTLVSRETKPDNISGLYARTYVYEKVAWRSWTNSLVCDYYEYENAGTANPKEIKINTWVGIASSSTKDAVDYLRGTADSGYKLKSVNVRNRRDGAIDIAQSMRVNYTNGATLVGSELIDPHALCSGTMNRTTVTYSGYENLTDLPTNSYTLGTNDVVAIQPTGPDGDGLFGLTVVAESTTWGAWSDEDKNTWDFISYDNPGLDGEGIVKSWCGIDGGDLRSAVTALYGSSFAETGYEVVSVSSRDDGDGSIFLSQALIQNLSYDSSAETDLDYDRAMDPHGLFSGTMSIKKTVYHNYSLTDIAALTPTVPAGYTFVDSQYDIDSRGLCSAVYLYEKPAWEKTWSSKVQMSDGNEGGWARIKGDLVKGVPKSGRAALLSAAVTAEDSSFIVSSVNLQEGSEGSLLASRTQKPVYATTTAGAATIIFYQDSVGSGDRLMKREWLRRTEAAKDTLIGSGGVAISDATLTFPGDTNTTVNTHYSVSINDNGDSSYNVVQTLRNASATFSIGLGDIHWSTSYEVKLIDTRARDNYENTKVYTVNAQSCSSERKAWDVIHGAAGDVMRGSDSVRRTGNSSYLARWTTIDSISGWAL